MTKGVSFLKNAIVGKKVGAIARSSKFVIKDILNILEKNEKFNTIVEYGPGDGVLTVELLKLLSKDGKMLVVEFDKNFIENLKEIKDKRLKILNGKMQDISIELEKLGFNNADLIISSVPFSLISKKEREEVVKNSSKSLVLGGKFIIFHQYSLLMEGMLKKYFKRVETRFEPRNILPCFIMSADKK